MPSDRIFDEFTDTKGIAAEVNRTPRTVSRWCAIPDGPPYVKLGSTRIFVIENFKKWLREREFRPNPRRT